jgi:cobalt/nickel transport system permease protein
MRLKRAAAARGYSPKWLPQAVIVGRLVGSLFIRSYERAERVYGAMRLRGYGSRMPTAAAQRLRMTDALAPAVFAVALVVVRIFIK